MRGDMALRMQMDTDYFSTEQKEIMLQSLLINKALGWHS